MAPVRAARRRRRAAADPARRGRCRSGRCRRRRSRAGRRRAGAPSRTVGSSRGPSSCVAIRPSSASWFLDSLRPTCFDRHWRRLRPGRHHQQAVALLARTIVGPQQPRRDRAPRPPGLGERAHFLGGRPGLQIQQQLGGFLQGEVAGRPGVRVSETGQKIDVGGPWADAVNGGERRVRLVGRHAGRATPDRVRRFRPPWRSPSGCGSSAPRARCA